MPHRDQGTNPLSDGYREVHEVTTTASACPLSDTVCVRNATVPGKSVAALIERLIGRSAVQIMIMEHSRG